MQKGKLIVIDGTDGSGKATQSELLSKRLKKEGYEVRRVAFPRHGKKSAWLVDEYLRGKYGSAKEVGPYVASIFYACDRYDASFEIRKFLKEGKIVISDRYVTANMGHQGGKIKDSKERKNFFKWLYNLEYRIFLLPKPDLTIIFHVDAAIAQKMVDKKDSRSYIKGKRRDLHEKSLNHLKNAEKAYQEMSDLFPDFISMKCTENKKIMSKEKISELVWKEAKKIIG